MRGSLKFDEKRTFEWCIFCSQDKDSVPTTSLSTDFFEFSSTKLSQLQETWKTYFYNHTNKGFS